MLLEELKVLPCLTQFVNWQLCQSYLQVVLLVCRMPLLISLSYTSFQAFSLQVQLPSYNDEFVQVQVCPEQFQNLYPLLKSYFLLVLSHFQTLSEHVHVVHHPIQKPPSFSLFLFLLHLLELKSLNAFCVWAIQDPDQ